MMSRLVTAAAVAALVASAAFPQSADPSIGSGNIDPSISWVVPQSLAARRGMAFVRAQCARCHAVDRVSASPLATAPPLHTLGIKYAVADLQRPLAEGIHPAMPRFRLTAGQLADVMAYLKTLEKETPGM
jgi:mono/diheme cytochrome c family protein